MSQNSTGTTRETNSKEDSILDTRATLSSVKNKCLLAGVHKAKDPMQVCVNAGKRLTWKKGTLLGVKDLPRPDKELLADMLAFDQVTQGKER